MKKIIIAAITIVEVGLICLAIFLIESALNSIDVKVIEVQAHPIVIEEEEEIEETIEEPEITIPVRSDVDVIAATVEGEGGNQPLVGKVAIAATMLNRMDRTGRSAESIALEAYNAYPYYGPVSEESYKAVEIAMNNRDLFPSDMMYFRADHYHDFGVPYCQIGDHYFSTKE